MQLVIADIEADPLAEVAGLLAAGGAAVDQRAGRRVTPRGHRAARRRGVRPLRRCPCAVQQRRRRQAGPDLGPHRRRLAVGARRRPVERHPCRAHVRAADAGRWRRRPHRQHGVDVRLAADPEPGRLQRCQIGGGGVVRGAAARSRRRGGEDRRVRAVPGLHRHPDHRQRAQPPARAHGRRSDPSCRPHDGGGDGDDGCRRRRRRGRRRDPRRSVLDPHPRRLPGGHPGACGGHRGRRPSRSHRRSGDRSVAGTSSPPR